MSKNLLNELGTISAHLTIIEQIILICVIRLSNKEFYTSEGERPTLQSL